MNLIIPFWPIIVGVVILIVLLLALDRHQQTRRWQTIHHELTNHLKIISDEQNRLRDQFIPSIQQSLLESTYSHKTHLQQGFNEFRANFDEHQLKSLKLLQEALQLTLQDVRVQVIEKLKQNTDTLDQRMQALTHETQKRLTDLSGEVEKRLSLGFEKTNATFTDVIKRLALIDEAQKKITELSTHVVSLQEILDDKRSRGAFGEVQLSALIQNTIPEQHYALQHTLSNGKRVDCILFLPQPTGCIAIDAKFPLESYQLFKNQQLVEQDRRQAIQQFRIDIKKHIQTIHEKYIIEGETSDGAVMFIPAEAIFAEIHAHYPDLVAFAQQHRVWMVSPTTLMAVLTTARSVLKDDATRKQIHVIKEHLQYLAKDFSLFQKRMDNLAKHIDQAHDDVKEATTSARKITSRFEKIEKVELHSIEDHHAKLIPETTVE